MVSACTRLSDTPAELAPDALQLQQAATKNSGALVSWGNNSNGQVGSTPTGDDFMAVAAGLNHSVALRSTGTLVSWGRNDYGQVGSTPTGDDFTAVAAGGYHSLALRSDGTLVSWGRDTADQVGSTPKGGGFMAVAAGGFYSVALRTDGTLVSWGSDFSGQVSSTPTGKDFIAVAAGSIHSLALRTDGTLVSWGRNSEGQVSTTPTGNDFIAVAGGLYHSVALRTDGTLVSWGSDFSGQVSSTPTGNDFTAVAAGGFNSVALRSNGTIVSWGNDFFGQVRSTPTGNDFIAVAAGGDHSVAIQASPTTDDTPPTITLTTPADGATYLLNQLVHADYSCADEEGGSGLASCVGDVASGAAIDTSSVGAKNFTVETEDNAGNSDSLTHDYTVVYDFEGFFNPIQNLPTLNVARAGGAIPVKFSLSGDHGLAIFASGSPSSQETACETSVPQDTVTETLTAGSSSLSYDAATDTYTYVWKTEKSWGNSCRTLTVKLIDGSEHVASFRFNK